MRRWLENKIIRMTRGMKLRGKILIMYSLILLLPSLLLEGSTLYIMIHSFHNNYVVTIEDSVRQTAKNVDFSKQSYDLLAIRTATDSELIARLSREYADMTQIIDTVNYLDRNFLVTSKYLPGIVDFRIYHTNDTLVQDGQLLWRPEARLLSGLDERTWYRKTLESASPILWSNAPDNPGQIVITRKILDSTGNPLGMVYILIDYNVVFGDLLDYPFKDGGSLYIVDDAKRVLATSERERIGSRILSAAWPDDPENAQDTGGSTYDLRSTKDLLLTEPISSGWYIVALTHMKYMDGQSRALLGLLAGTSAALLLLSAFLMLTIVKNIVARIRRLGIHMSDLSQGEFDVAIRAKMADELGELEGMFNRMSVRLGKLMEDTVKAGLQEKEQAFKAMQAQINPHFVYNSLGLLRWRAMDLRDEVQIRIIDALTTFYRLTLNNQLSSIPIREELEHVKAYLEVQELRYPGKVQIIWEVYEAVLDYFTIKTVLQPLVENCYSHGAITRGKDAVIRIAVLFEDGSIKMSVCDNGQGISRDILEAIEAGSYTGNGNGFGMVNIRERLALYFGEAAHLMIESEFGTWTKVSIIFPVCVTPPVVRRGSEYA